MEGPKLSSVLVTGGDHFIGWHLISKILEIEPDCKISVLDLPSSLPRFPGVTYYDIDLSITRRDLYELDKIKPHVIFHAACTYSLALPASTFWKVNYIGTQNILQAAKAVGTVKAFIYHCSSFVIEDGISNVLNATEDFPVLFAPEQKYPYPLSKAHAEKAVLDANDRGGMLTVSMRPAGTYGEADFEMMESLIGNAKRRKANVQMGDGKNVYDWTYVGNYVHAHMLAAKALLRDSDRYTKNESIEPSMRVDGEIFHITNDDPWLFWKFTREVAKQAGFEVREEQVKVIPRWVGMLIAFIAEWWVWIVSFGRRQSALTRGGVRYSCLDRTVRCEKVQRVLGYKPIWGTQEGLERSVDWFRENGYT